LGLLSRRYWGYRTGLNGENFLPNRKIGQIIMPTSPGSKKANNPDFSAGETRVVAETPERQKLI